MGKISHQKFPDFDKVFRNEIFDRFTLFPKFDDFSVVEFVMIVGFYIWLDCGDLERARKGKAHVGSTSGTKWGKWLSKLD